MERIGTLKTVGDVDEQLRVCIYVKQQLLSLLLKTEQDEIMDLIKHYKTKIQLLENKRQELLELMKQKNA